MGDLEEEQFFTSCLVKVSGCCRNPCMKVRNQVIRQERGRTFLQKRVAYFQAAEMRFLFCRFGELITSGL